MADPRRLREILGFGYGAPSPAMSALEPLHAGVDPQYMPQDKVTASPEEGPNRFMRSGLESLFGLFAPEGTSAAEQSEKVTNLLNFTPLGLPQEAFDIGKGLGDTLQGGDPRMLAMSLIPGKAAEGATKVAKKAANAADDLVSAVKDKQVYYRGARDDQGALAGPTGFTHFSKDPKVAAGGERGFIDPDDFPDMPRELFDVPEGLRVTPAHLDLKNTATMDDLNRVAPNARTVQEGFPALKEAGFDSYTDDMQTVTFDQSQISPVFGGKADELVPAGEGSRNYVVFSDEINDIVKKYGIAGALGAGLITQQMADQLQAQQGGGQS
jgi:hypothetical protein